MRDGPAAGLALVDAILARGELADYQPAHAARADLCRRLGRDAEARESYRRALELTQQGAARRFLERRLAELACPACRMRRCRGVISISNLTKTYASGQHALKSVSLDIRPGEIFALLGPNGAGKTTLISIVCGIVRATSGTVLVDGHDIQKDYRAARERIGLVPQELAIEAFETVRAAAAFSRGLFGRAPDPAHVERVLRDLSLWDRRDDILMTLSGGMKRRVMIAKALAHEPRILFLDEPTAGVDVELRRDMWALVRRLRDQGVTIILTTHYIDEAEEMADRIGVVNHGELIVVDEKKAR